MKRILTISALAREKPTSGLRLLISPSVFCKRNPTSHSIDFAIRFTDV
jgi:hypothetical protein